MRLPGRATAAIVVVAVITAAGGTPTAQAPRPPVQVRTESERAIQSFLALWYNAWTATQAEQHDLGNCGSARCPARTRIATLHCHREYTQTASTLLDARTRLASRNLAYIEPERFIESAHSAFAVCPGWMLGTLYARGDERLAIDNALNERNVARVRPARDSLIATLATTRRAAPADDFVLGQLVRFLIDQGLVERAVAEAELCGGSLWWCTALAGYALGRAHQFARADAAFERALVALPDSVRCAWTDLSELLDPNAAEAYRRIPCAERDAANARIWWLADPLYIHEGNERRVEHFLRHMRIALASALDRDERYAWRAALGNDARIRMLIRYGWPTYAYWDGFAEDTSHTLWLEGARQGYGRANDPYTTYEYSTGRLHTFPSAAAIAQPLAATHADWELTERERKDPEAFPPRPWWPREHFSLDIPVTQLAEPQVVLLRRQDSVLLAVSVHLDSTLGRLPGQAVHGISLLTTERPDTVRVVARRSGEIALPAALSALIPARPTLVGIELPAISPTRGAARTRFAVTPPPPLSAMQPGERAISTPAILMAPWDGQPPPTRTDSALHAMAGDTRVQPVGRIGVYWETYGFALTDTVEFAVWIERFTPQGIVRRLATSLNIAEDLNTPVATRWTEIPGRARVHTVPGTVPIHGRSVSLDVSKLRSGNYWLDIAARTPSGEVVRGRTAIVVP